MKGAGYFFLATIVLIIASVYQYQLPQRSIISNSVYQKTRHNTANQTIVDIKRIPLPGYPSFDPQSPTILVQLGGEMANNLGFLAAGLVDAWEMEERFGWRPTIVVRHQMHGKWVRGNRDIHQCFPQLGLFNFSAGNIPEIDEIVRQQSPETILRTNLTDFRDNYLNFFNATKRIGGYMNLPFYQPSGMLHGGSLFRKYRQPLRNLFTYSDSCCQHLAYSNETVFQLRGFRAEMPKVWDRKGFWEVGPHRAAQDLLNNATQVALISRFSYVLPPYQEALQERNISARIVKGQSGPQDFCLLLKAKRVVCTAKSTYCHWACILGDHEYTLLYQANRAGRPRRYTENPSYVLLENVTDWRR